MENKKRKWTAMDTFGIFVGIFLLLFIMKACSDSGSSRDKSIYDAPDDVKKGFYEWKQKQNDK